MGLIDDLRQRKLVQWALAYAAAAFAVVQGVDIVASKFGWPESIARIAIIAASVGFVVTLVLAWFHGERGAQRMSSMELMLLALLLALGVGLSWRFAPDPRALSGAAVTGAASVGSIPAADSKSIAVLPFENLSADPENAYFATGMQDEILTRLAGIRDLKVISRTSTQQYASRPPNLRIVAEQLGVATVLEGSVQKSGGKVRINLQLIDARSDSHLWAQNYDRDLADVFAVQSDVAGRVAEALKAQLLPAESARVANVPTKSPEAYDNFLRAEYLVSRLYIGAGKDWQELAPKAQAYYQGAIDADPLFALAHARLSYLKSVQYWFGIDPGAATLAAAEAAATRALELQPDLPEAHLAQGYVKYWGHQDFAAALAEFEIARAQLPNDAEVLKSIAAVHRRQGELALAISESERAMALDPRNATLPWDLAASLLMVRRYHDAVAACDRALALAPDNVYASLYKASALMMDGELEAAARVLASVSADNDPQGNVSRARFDVAMAMRQPETALAALANAPAWMFDRPAALSRAAALSRKGDTAAARAAYLDAEAILQARMRDLPGQLNVQSDAQGTLSIAYAGLGRKDAALAAARRATELSPMAHDANSGAAALAQLAAVETRFGEIDAALDHLRQLVAAPAGHALSAASLRFDQDWDPLREDARFKKLIVTAEAAQPKGRAP